MPVATLELGREARSAGSARRFVADVLKAWDAGGYRERAELVVSELVTNALLHARTEIFVRVTLLAEGLRLEVGDGSPSQPMVRHYSRLATTGRGLALVAAMARDWGISPVSDGKIVWADLDLTDRSGEAGDVALDLFDSDDELWGTTSTSPAASQLDNADGKGRA